MGQGNSDSEARKNVLVQEQSVDWHVADIKGALEKRGLTLAEVSRRAGYHPTAAGRALRTSWPELERVIATALGVSPSAIWPSRYDDAGVPLKYQPRKLKRRTVGHTEDQ